MSEKRACPECGVSLPPGASKGPCPRCLMGAGVSATGSFRPPAPSPVGPAPAPSTVDFDEFRRAAIEAGLVDAEGLERLAAEATGDVPRLARALVRAGKMTAYQANALAQGKARGLVIGSYLVLQKRGQGGMGVVFRARHRESGRVVALKILLPSFGRDGEAVRRFRREFELAARLDHPNVVAALEADEDRGVQFLTMEYVEGSDLEDVVREVGPLPIKMSLHCAIQAARGLAAAHSQGIIHRDVKPGNLMLGPDGAVRVLDLGLARVIEASSPLGRVGGGTLTQSGAYMGTVDYVAPEQANDSKKADHRADIYSLGCTLYFLLAGRPPFEGETILQRLMAHQQRPAPSLHAARDDVPAALEAAYQTMMAKKPGDRPRSMDEVIGLLEGCRGTADEARQARTDLRDFAETFLKRAAPRRRDRSPDASVFARRTVRDGLKFDPDLNLEDLVMDYRDEAKVGALTGEQLPPMMPRLAPPRKRRRVKPPRALILGVGAASACVAGYVLWPQRPAPEAARPASPPPIVAPLTVSTPGPGWTSLFNGKDLAGWVGEVGGYEVRDGALSCKPDRRATIYVQKILRDYAVRVEFRLEPGANSGLAIHYPGEGDAAYSGLCEIQVLDDSSPKYVGNDPKGSHGSAFGMAAARRGSLKPVGQWNAQVVTVRGSAVKVELNGEVILDADLDLTPGPATRTPYTGRGRKAGYFGLCGMPGARAEYRKIEVRNLEGVPGPAKATAPGIASPAEPPRTLFAAEFTDRVDHFPEEPPASGYAGGVFFSQRKEPGFHHYDTRGSLVDFSCEAVGRVLRSKSTPAAHGSWGLQVVTNNNRGLEVLINNEGQLRVQPTSHTGSRHPKDPTVGLVDVRRRRLEVVVNNILVCEPVEVAWDLTPAWLVLGVWADAPTVRVEFDRVECRTLPPDTSSPAPDGAGSWMHTKNRRFDFLPGGVVSVGGETRSTWSQAGPILGMRSPREGAEPWIDRMELDESGTHYRGSNQSGDWIYGYRIPAGSVANSLGMAMVPIPAGEFEMGTSAAQVDAFIAQFPAARRDLFADEQPAHRVRISRPFYLGATEVTVDQLRAFVKATGYKTDAEREARGTWTVNDQGAFVEDPTRTWDAPGFEQNWDWPVVNVSWNDAVAFCAWLGKKEGKTYRLPTEAEWEYAARAGSTARYAGGDGPERLAEFANVADIAAKAKFPAWPTFPVHDGYERTAPVAEFRPNAFGLYDTIGNVWEWCADYYDATYYGQKVLDDPRGPAEGSWRAYRGGGWAFDPPSCRPADRAGQAPNLRGTATGFRILLER